MKKIYINYALILLSIFTLSLSSCTEDPKEEPKPDSIEISSENLNIAFTDKASADKSITFTASPEWLAKPSANWLHVSPSSGTAGSGTIAINVDDNTDTDDRMAKITITAGTAKKEITVTQKASLPNIKLNVSGELQTELNKLYEGGLTPATLTYLTITGAEMNIDDFTVLKSLTALSFLDISQTATLEIPTEQFLENKVITQIILPEGLTTIGYRSFSGSGLTSVKIPISVIVWKSKIGLDGRNYAFSYCEDLTSVELPEGLTTIGYGAFITSGLISVKIPSTITKLARALFWKCHNLTSVEFPDKGLTTIGSFAFEQSGLTSVKIPSSITTWENEDGFGGGYFLNCKNLASIEFAEGLTTIGYRAFSNSPSLREITLPASLESIEDKAFAVCDNLLVVTLLNATAPTIFENTFSSDIINNIFVPENSETSYQTAEHWSKFEDKISTRKETIATNIKHYNLISIAQSLDIKVLSNTEVNEITILPAGTDWIVENSTKSFTDNRYNFSISENTTGVEREVEIIFKNKQTNISKTITILQYEKVEPNLIVLEESGDLANELLKRPATITKLSITGAALNQDDFAILYEYNLISYLDISQTATLEIIDEAFAMNEYLTQIILPEGLTTIGNWAFTGSGLTSVKIPASVTVWGRIAFFGCENLTEVLFAEGLTTIGSEAFAGASFTSVTLPSSIKNIGEQAFYHCKFLTTVTSENPIPPVIFENSFSPEYIDNIYVPENSVEAYKTAEFWSELADKISTK